MNYYFHLFGKLIYLTVTRLISLIQWAFLAGLCMHLRTFVSMLLYACLHVSRLLHGQLHGHCHFKAYFDYISRGDHGDSKATFDF